MDFENIKEHIVSMDKFRLKWRFTDDKYDNLSEIHLHQLQPLDEKASKFLSDYLSETNLHNDIPFKKEFYRNIDKVRILDNNEKEIKKWLYHRGIAFEKEVFLLWHATTAMIVPWKLFIKYFDSFYYSASDDLMVFDQSLNWALLVYHHDEIYFGTNKNFKKCDELSDYNFIW